MGHLGFPVKISLARLLLITAVLIAVTTASAVAYILWSQPVQLRVAAGPQDGKDAAILAAFDRTLEAMSAGVRLKLVTTAGLHENSVLLGEREVDLAVVRLDEAIPTTAALVAILRTDAVIAVAPARHKLENLPELTGRRVGLISRSPLDEPSFIRVLDAFGLKPADVKLTTVKPEEVGPLTSSGRIDCVVVIGVPADPEVSAVVYAVAGTKQSSRTISLSRSANSSSRAVPRWIPSKFRRMPLRAGSFRTKQSKPSAFRPYWPPTGSQPVLYVPRSTTMRSLS